MTIAQERKVELIKKLFEKRYVNSEVAKEHEIKKCEVFDKEFYTELRIEGGLIGDEGTYAELYGRDRIQVFIGKKGGVTYCEVNKKTRKWTIKRWTNNVIWTLICANN